MGPRQFNQLQQLGGENMKLAMELDIPAGRKPAKLLMRDRVNTRVTSLACLALARFGDEADIDQAVQPLLEASDISAEIRTAALICGIRLSGLNPKEFGFTNLRTDPQTVYALDSIQLSDEAQLQASLTKWSEFLDERALLKD